MRRVNKVMRLCDSDVGKVYTVGSINLRSETTRRLEMLGMTKGTAVTVMNKKRSGPVIVKVRGTRFALGRNFAEGIIVN